MSLDLYPPDVMSVHEEGDSRTTQLGPRGASPHSWPHLEASQSTLRAHKAAAPPTTAWGVDSCPSAWPAAKHQAETSTPYRRTRYRGGNMNAHDTCARPTPNPAPNTQTLASCRPHLAGCFRWCCASCCMRCNAAEASARCRRRAACSAASRTQGALLDSSPIRKSSLLKSSSLSKMRPIKASPYTCT